MNELTLALFPYLLSCGLSALIGYYAWQHRESKSVFAYAIYALAQTFWVFGYIWELNAKTLEGKQFWDNFQYFVFLTVPSAQLIFSWEYIGRKVPRIRWVWGGIGLASLVMGLLAYTSPSHGLVSYDYELRSVPPFNVYYYQFGILAVLGSLYLLFAVTASTVILFWYSFRIQGTFRAQTLAVGFGVLIPLLGSLLSTTFVLQLAGQRDISPLTYGIANLFVAWGLFRYRLFSLVPIAREAVLDSMISGVIVIDPDFKIVDSNPAAVKMLGKPDLIGQSMTTALPDYLEFVQAHQFNERTIIEREVQHADQRLYYELTLSSIRNLQGELVGNLLVLRNITDRVKAQQESQARTRELEQAQAQIQALYDEQVKIAEGLRALDQMKSQFLASMSHELRTPLNAILNFTEFMSLGMLGPVTEKQTDALSKVLSSARHLLALINDVLDITKIEAGMMQLFVEKDINLQPELNQVIAATQTLLKDKDIQFITEIEENLPVIVGDKRRIRQILLNLLSNAAKFTEEGSITLSVKQQHENLLFTVTDTGPGIPAKDHDSIFEPFVQTEAGIRHAGGTGLGLPITKRLVEAHGGKLWLESQVQHGTSFYVLLPQRSEQLLSLMKLPEAA